MSNKNPNLADLTNAVKDAFSRFIDFAGVSTRPQYWYFILTIAIASAVVGIVFGENGQNALTLIILLPTIAVSIRRMHDVGKSGWFILIPIYNIVLLASPTTVAVTVPRKFSLVGAGLFVAVSPIIGAFLYSLLKGGSMFSTGDSTGAGTFLFFLIFTLPLGLLLIAIGVIVESSKRSKP
jgi:uncharacterized membrane protein YhaH (DUF805 family)